MRLIRRFLILLGLAICLCQPRIGLGEPRSAKHFLWRVVNVAQPFYLLGSIHALRASDYPVGAEVDGAVGQCHRFVLEWDNYHLDEALWRKKIRETQYYPAGTTLRQKVHPATYAYLRRIAKVRASEYDDTRPWAIACFMMRYPLYYDVRNEYGIEGYVTKRAPFLSEFGGLETLEEHIGVVASLNDRESELFLLQTILYSDRNPAAMEKVVTAYKTGDTHGLVAVNARWDREAPELRRHLIDRRNAAWIPRIEQEIKSGKPTMIVVGARHLCGPQNVIAMLRAKGYQLEQL